MKSAKLCAEQGQIEKRLSQAMTSFRVDRKDECSPPPALTGYAGADKIRLTANPPQPVFLFSFLYLR